ncbi:hypothetical protein [Mahella sp.]|uniref:hypothetical protein n=1 Tax=Mahella sp. TaxID=2798721 RepID=UPI0025C6AE1E|nr:hypothetical protein [Mahella sp.]MBZ4665679.1 hypothetical protein [Mahella sp.]MDK2992261.1 hypothetical protein [Clostridiales bacterium]
MEKFILLLLFVLMMFSLSACQKAVEPSDAPDEDAIIQAIHDAWDDTVTKAGGRRTGSVLLLPGAYGANADRVCNSLWERRFKVFINYDSNGNLYNYTIWKNS